MCDVFIQTYMYYVLQIDGKKIHIVTIARLEPFRPLKYSKLEDLRALKPCYQIGAF